MFVMIITVIILYIFYLNKKIISGEIIRFVIVGGVLITLSWYLDTRKLGTSNNVDLSRYHFDVDYKLYTNKHAPLSKIYRLSMN